MEGVRNSNQTGIWNTIRSVGQCFFFQGILDKVKRIWNWFVDNKQGLYVIETLEAVQGKGKQLKVELLDLVPLSRREKGCISYDLFMDKTNPERFTIVMHWTHREAYDAHNQSLHVDGFVRKFENSLYQNSKVVEDLYDRLA